MLIQEFSNPLNASPLVFPALECFHITGFAILVGTIAIQDFRLLGIGMTHQKAEDLYKDLSPWTLIGLAIMLVSGPMMFSSDPDMYYLNWSFLIKMVFLLAAIVFNYTVHKKTLQAGAAPGTHQGIAFISLFLWAAVVFGGIFIGFVGEGLSLS